MLSLPDHYTALPVGDVGDLREVAAHYSGYAAQRLSQGRAVQPLHQALLAMKQATASDTEDALGQALRCHRQDVLLAILAADLSGQATLNEVTEAMSQLAESSLQRAADFLYQDMVKQYGTPQAHGVAQPFFVIGMGKLGGRELNVSSDIDLIFTYPEEGETEQGMANQSFFIQLARRLLKIMGEVTEHGFVFRVDMRLRPNGEAGALASSFAALERYFYEQGREWERYAWIKARIVACARPTHLDVAKAERELEALRRPFVFRKYLDYDAIHALRELHRQIRAERSRRDATHPARANDIKLGRGGIREIEFIAQLFQLIRGGRTQELQSRATCDTLSTVGALGLMEPEAIADLKQAYVFLRSLEHRLQYTDDAQTHAVPLGDEQRAHVAAMMGYTTTDAFLAALDSVRTRVADIFDNLFGHTATATGHAQLTAPSWFSHALETEKGRAEAVRDLSAQGFSDADELARSFAALVRSTRFRALPAQSRTRVDGLITPLLQAAKNTSEPPQTVLRFLDLIEAVARRSAYLALLTEHPGALRRVAAVLSASPWAAKFLTQHPLLLDELMVERSCDLPSSWHEERHELETALTHATLDDGSADIEKRLNILREFHQLWTFRLLAIDIAGRITVEKLADHLSALADVLLEVVLEQAWAKLPKKHRERPQFCIVAYGKLGGKELSYGSDLDLIFIYDDDDEQAAEVYAQLARRIMSWLTSYTSAGRLFNVDLRLRPNGNAGLLVTSVQAFAHYQLGHGSNAAWLWEHQALTRARYCAGSRLVGEKFEALRREVLMRPRERGQVLKDVAAMRKKVHEGHPNTTGLFDLKHDHGGMVDIEFIVQACVLFHAHQQPELTRNMGTTALLGVVGEEKLLDKKNADDCATAYRHYRAQQYALRLQSEADEPPPARVAPEVLKEDIQAVQRAWHHLFGEPA